MQIEIFMVSKSVNNTKFNHLMNGLAIYEVINIEYYLRYKRETILLFTTI